MPCSGCSTSPPGWTDAISDRWRPTFRQRLIRSESSLPIDRGGAQITKILRNTSRSVSRDGHCAVTDPGALVQNATSSQTSALPVLTVSQIDRLRVFVYVDQRAAASVRVGDPSEIYALERPDILRKGKVARLSRELDPKSKTMLAEVHIENTDQAIIPGSFVTVSLGLSVPRWLEIIEALIFRGKDPFVAVVDDQKRVKYRPVKLADQDGQRAQLLEGLSEGELVALNLGEEISDGARIQPVPADAPPPARK